MSVTVHIELAIYQPETENPILSVCLDGAHFDSFPAIHMDPALTATVEAIEAMFGPNIEITHNMLPQPTSAHSPLPNPAFWEIHSYFWAHSIYYNSAAAHVAAH